MVRGVATLKLLLKLSLNVGSCHRLILLLGVAVETKLLSADGLFFDETSKLVWSHLLVERVKGLSLLDSLDLIVNGDAAQCLNLPVDELGNVRDEQDEHGDKEDSARGDLREEHAHRVVRGREYVVCLSNEWLVAE